MSSVMQLRTRRLILIHALLLPVFVMFTNCDRISQEGASQASSSPSMLANNGGGHSGKLKYLHTSALEGCDVAPDLGIVRDGNDIRAFTYECGNSVEGSIDISRLISFDLNPYFLVYDELIFAHEEVLEIERTVDAHIDLFCTSASGIDVAVRTKSIDTAGGNYTEQSGLIFTKGDTYPLIGETRGIYKDPTSAGVRVFKASGGEYTIQTQVPYSTSRALGEIKFASGDAVDLDCFIRTKSSSDK